MFEFDASALGLFDTLVPIASIITISILVAYILPRNEYLGLFLLGWWALAVVISLQNNLFAEVGKWSSGDWQGVLVLMVIPVNSLGTLYIWFQRSPKVRVFIYKEIPLWTLFAIHVYRLDGVSIILPFWRGSIPKYLGLQMILLDVLIGAASIPLAWIAYSRGVDSMTSSGRWQKDAVWFWNSLGLYDLTSAYVVLLLNFCQMGGSYVTDPPLSTLGFHPIPLIVLFQAPLAISIHLLLLTSMDQIVQHQTSGLPLHIQRIRRQQ